MEQKNISIWNYGNYSNSNYGSSRAVSVGNLDLYFSYKTVIAFRSHKDGLVICENVWSRTTGKHLNWIHPNKKIRLSSADFEKKLDECLKRHNLVVK